MDKNAVAVNVFNKAAQLYQDKFMDVSAYRQGLDLFCAAIEKPGGSVLEIACGPGNITRYVLEQRPDFQLLGTDLAPNMIELAKANNPAANFMLLDARYIGKLEKQYDGVLCGFLFPYFSKKEAIDFLTDAAAILNPGGVLYLSTMEDDYSKSTYVKASTGDEVFMHYHEAAYLKAALEAGHCEILHEEHIPSTGAGSLTATDLVLIAKKER